jgi:RNA polymerase sigma factor (TIGR02999 family)
VPGHTLSTTALVHEAYLRLVDQTRAQWADRAQFFGVAAHSMRRVLVDHARRHRAARRGGVNRATSRWTRSRPATRRTSRPVTAPTSSSRWTRRSTGSPHSIRAQARVVECRFFGGLTESETADALGVTARTVARDWVKARGWLYQELGRDEL